MLALAPKKRPGTLILRLEPKLLSVPVFSSCYTLRMNETEPDELCWRILSTWYPAASHALACGLLLESLWLDHHSRYAKAERGNGLPMIFSISLKLRLTFSLFGRIPFKWTSRSSYFDAISVSHLARTAPSHWRGCSGNVVPSQLSALLCRHYLNWFLHSSNSFLASSSDRFTIEFEK